MPRIFTANIVVHPSQNEPKKNEFLLSAPLEKEDGNIKLLHIRISQFFFILDCTAQLVYDVSFFFLFQVSWSPYLCLSFLLQIVTFSF